MKKKKRTQKKEKRQRDHWTEKYASLIEDSDENFSYIAGYTGAGFAYGTTWEEEGIDSALPYEEKIRLLDEKYKIDFPVMDDLPF